MRTSCTVSCQRALLAQNQATTRQAMEKLFPQAPPFSVIAMRCKGYFARGKS